MIESFTRADIGASLLAPRATVIEAAPPAAGDRRPRPTHRATRGVQIFGAMETSIGSDQTNWLGGQIGACITFGPVCAAARIRKAEVVAGEGVWKQGIDRGASETLLGIDVPFTIGRTTLLRSPWAVISSASFLSASAAAC